MVGVAGIDQDIGAAGHHCQAGFIHAGQAHDLGGLHRCGNGLVLGGAGHDGEGDPFLVVVGDAVAGPGELGVVLVHQQGHLVVGGRRREGHRQRALRSLVKGHGQVPLAALQAGHEVVPVGVDELDLDLQHLLAEVPAQVHEVAAVLASRCIPHDVRSGHGRAAAQYASLLDVFPDLRFGRLGGDLGKQCADCGNTSDHTADGAREEPSHFESLR
ncbi:hypothetical protein D3C78_1121780 [compost metagenome]